jgi:hypothetical protein
LEISSGGHAKVLKAALRALEIPACEDFSEDSACEGWE